MHQWTERLPVRSFNRVLPQVLGIVLMLSLRMAKHVLTFPLLEENALKCQAAYQTVQLLFADQYVPRGVFQQGLAQLLRWVVGKLLASVLVGDVNRVS